MIPASRFLPAAPLLEKAGGVQNLARSLGAYHKTVDRWRVAGRVPVYQADEAAVALGCHPSEIWGDAWLEVGDLRNPDWGR